MRLLLLCIVLLLAPAGSLWVANRAVSGAEDDFQEDASRQVKRFQRVAELYPPRAAQMKSAPQLVELQRLKSGGEVVNIACAAQPIYERLFERLILRCGEWQSMKRARNWAALGLAASVLMLGAVLIARIGVQRSQASGLPPAPATVWFAMRGIRLLLAAQAALALAGWAVLLKLRVSKPAFAYAAMAPVWLALFWLERRLMAAFLEPEKLRQYSAAGAVKRTAHRRRRSGPGSGQRLRA
jgi:hypothetical protein